MKKLIVKLDSNLKIEIFTKQGSMKLERQKELKKREAAFLVIILLR